MTEAWTFDDPPAVTVRCPAKLNLYLGVGAPRGDGFHPLATVYHAIGLYDDVTVTVAGEWSVHVSGDPRIGLDEVPGGEENLAVRGARALLAHHGCDDELRVEIHKGIPVAGGMAGGSADAAAALVATDRLLDLGTPDEDLLGLARSLGSDVPFALVGGNALGTGRGELVEQLPGAEVPRWWVLVTSAAGLDTPAVYAEFDRLSPGAPAEAAPPTGLLPVLAGESSSLAAELHNDLQAAACALRDDLTLLLRDGENAGALRGVVSGSGPTCAFLCAGPDEAREVAGALVDAYGDRVLVANGAVPGAHVVEYDR